MKINIRTHQIFPHASSFTVSTAQINKAGFRGFLNKCHMENHSNVLEIGCGDGSLWLENKEKIPEQLHVVLSDISEGMLRDTRRMIHSNIQNARFDFRYLTANGFHIPMTALTSSLPTMFSFTANISLTFFRKLPAC